MLTGCNVDEPKGSRRFRLSTTPSRYTVVMGHSSQRGTVVTIEQITPTTTETNTPKCPRCGGSSMHLERIEPDKPQHDRRIFRCETCGESVSETVKYR
jgi:transposase-like protein